jgi:hypothetical protein
LTPFDNFFFAKPKEKLRGQNSGTKCDVTAFMEEYFAGFDKNFYCDGHNALE